MNSYFFLLLILPLLTSCNTTNKNSESSNAETLSFKGYSSDDFNFTGFINEIGSKCNEGNLNRWEGARYMRAGNFVAIIPTNHAQLPPLRKMSLIQNILPIANINNPYQDICAKNSIHEFIFPLSIVTNNEKDFIQLKKESINPSSSGSFDIELEQIFNIAGSDLILHVVFDQNKSEINLKLSGNGLQKIKIRAGSFENSQLKIQQTSHSFEFFSPESFWLASFISPSRDVIFQKDKYFYFSSSSKETPSLELQLKFDLSHYEPSSTKTNEDISTDSLDNSPYSWWTEPNSTIQIQLPKDTFNLLEAKLQYLAKEKKSLSAIATLKELLEQQNPPISVESLLCPQKFLPYTNFEAFVTILNPKKWDKLQDCEKFIPHFDLNSFIE